MGKIDNIVVECLDNEHGQELKKAFKALGINVDAYKFNCTKRDNDICRYYGVVDGRFDTFTIGEIDRKVKFLTLEELRGDNYPKVMYVGDNKEHIVMKRNVVGKFFHKGHTYFIAETKDNGALTFWKYAKDIEEVIPEYTMEELVEKLGHNFKIKK